jgi:hypothetical protein
LMWIKKRPARRNPGPPASDQPSVIDFNAAQSRRSGLH